ncbi:metalloregulator ArsR/SmtB family transcription factor [Serinibacter salmoneus]|uniref:ArsR family transcriptional regulator n=1 Tax=Serinibacter salmoneus TaxID=556530 RepID=A0A2A9CVX3_9MICO|nr:metalloregulator ArsR/SmtB family transcription factor [Serinibacter salmoneus]PFG18568.1 ArsR family transcriptional regulator [Serinibacter salmoneus]
MTTIDVPIASDGVASPATGFALGEETAAVLAPVLKAMADPLRLRMLSHISASPSAEACVCDLAELTELSQPTVSHHLKVMREAGLLATQRRGTWVWYSLAPTYRDAVTHLLSSFAPTVVTSRCGPEHPHEVPEADEELATLAKDLAREFPALPDELVLATCRESFAGLARSAGIGDGLFAATAQFARQRLEDLTRDRTGSRPQVLFVCVQNAGRSQLAAAIARSYAGDAVVVRSAGSTPAAQVHPGVQAVLDDLGTAPEAFPKPLTDDAVRAADVVITMGCGDVCPIVPGVRYEDWQVGDPALASEAGVAAIAEDLDNRVRALLEDLTPDLALPTTQ